MFGESSRVTTMSLWNVDPPQPGTPINLAKRGQWQELVVPNRSSLQFSGTVPFMPVQYVTGHYDGSDIGSPAMVQMIPTSNSSITMCSSRGWATRRTMLQVVHEFGVGRCHTG